MYPPSLPDRVKDAAKIAMELIAENPLYVATAVGITAWFAFLGFLISDMAAHADALSSIPPAF